MKLFAGLDISLRDTHICIVDEDGKVIRETRVLTEPDDICRSLSAFKKALARVGFSHDLLGVGAGQGRSGMPMRDRFWLSIGAAACDFFRQGRATIVTLYALGGSAVTLPPGLCTYRLMSFSGSSRSR